MGKLANIVKLPREYGRTVANPSPNFSAEIEAERGGTAFRQFISRRNAVPPLLMKHRSGLRRNAFRHLVVPTYHTKNCRGHFTQKKISLASLAIFVPLYKSIYNRPTPKIFYSLLRHWSTWYAPWSPMLCPRSGAYHVTFLTLSCVFFICWFIWHYHIKHTFLGLASYPCVFHPFYPPWLLSWNIHLNYVNIRKPKWNKSVNLPFK